MQYVALTCSFHCPGWYLPRYSTWWLQRRVYFDAYGEYALKFSIQGPESCGIIAPPFVVSVSYGQDESTVTPAFANRQCTEYAKVLSFILFYN